jgi:3-dehydroquinate synthase
MLAAARLSTKLCGLPAEDNNRIERIIASLGIDCFIPREIVTEDILAALQGDKKKTGDEIHFVLLKRIGIPFISSGISKNLLLENIEKLKA